MQGIPGLSTGIPGPVFLAVVSRWTGGAIAPNREGASPRRIAGGKPCMRAGEPGGGNP